MKRNIIIAVLLAISVISLGSLIPGGPIETRDFSHISPVVLGGFNIFLTTLGIVSLLLLYFVIKQFRWSFVISFFCGLSYFLVYVLDLAHIFPVSPTPMSQALFVIEIAGTVFSLPLMFLSIVSYGKAGPTESTARRRPLWLYAIFLLLFLLGVGIVIFATNAAMGN